MLKRWISALAFRIFLLATPKEELDGLLGQHDNRFDHCPACGLMGEYCPRDLCDQFHDACLGHIEGATSACCGHGLDYGHVLIGDQTLVAQRQSGGLSIPADAGSNPAEGSNNA